MPDNSQFVNDLAKIGTAVSKGGTDLVKFNEARNQGNLSATENQILIDRSKLTPFEFLQTYGSEVQNLLNQADQGRVALGQYMKGAESTPEQDITDSITDVATGLNRTLGGAAALGAGLVHPSLGVEANLLLNDFDEYNRRNMSSYTKRNEFIEGIRAQLDEEDNSALFDKEVESDGSFMASLKYVGRDVLKAGERIIANPAAMKSTVAQGVGSLLAIAPVTKVLSAAGASTGASVPTAIGVTEAGGAYSGTVTDIMDRSHEELLETSPEYRTQIEAGVDPETAKARIADTAGKLASSIQGPIAAAIGKAAGVADFEAAPFASRSLNKAAGMLVREPVEEASQSFTGQIAQNVATAYEADPEQSLIEGAGSQAVLGAVGGLGAAAVVQAPNVVVRSAAKAVSVPTKYVVGKVWERAARNQAEAEATSTVTDANLAPAVAAVAEQAEYIGAGLRTVAAEQGEVTPEVEDYIRKVQQASTVSVEDLAGIPSNLAPIFQIQEDGTSPLNRFDAVSLASKVATSKDLPEAERIAAAVFVIKQIEDNKQLFEEDFPAFLEKVAPEREEFQLFSKYAGVIQTIEENPAVSEALDWARTKMQMTDQDLSGVDLATPEGQVIVRNAVNVAKSAPQALSQQIAASILLQSDEGKVPLTPADKKILRNATSLLNSAKLYAAQNKSAETTPEVESAPTENIDFITKQIETEGGSKRHQRSLAKYVTDIAGAVAKGDMETVRQRVEQLNMFARSHRNKVQAANKSIQNGDGKNVRYKAFDGREVYTSEKGWGVIVGNEGSERQTRQIHAEAMAIAQMANDFVKQYPEFGFKEVTVPALALDTKKGSSTPVDPQPAPATTSEKVSNDQQEELPLPLTEPTREPETVTQADEVSASNSTDQSRNSSSEQDPVFEEDWRVANLTPEKVKTLSDERLADWVELIEEAPVDVRPESYRKALAALTNEINLRQPEPVIEPVVETVPDPVETKESTDAVPVVETVVETEVETKAEPTLVLDETTARPLLEETGELDDSTPVTNVAEAFPSLVQPGKRNFFQEVFRLPKTPRARLVALTQPMLIIHRLLNRQSDMEDFVGGEFSYDISTDDRTNLQQFIELGNTALIYMEKRLAAKIEKNGLEAKFDKGDDEQIIRTRDLRALNIIEKTKDGYQYNQELIQAAVLAGLDWVLNTRDRPGFLKTEDVARILGVEEDLIRPNHVKEFNRGVSLESAKRDIAENIRKFWGVEADKKARDGLTKGIPEAIAAEILHGLGSVDLVALGIRDRALTFADFSSKKFNRIWFDERSPGTKDFLSLLSGVREIFSDMALIEKEIVGASIGKALTDKDVDHKQLHNPMVDTTKQQKRALRNTQKTAYEPNQVMFDLVEGMGKEFFVSLFSGRLNQPYKEGDLKKSHKDMKLNRGHWESLQGLQRSLVASFENVSAHMAAVQKHEDSKASFYKHAINKLGRMMMQGASNPQTDKYARHVFMPTKAKINLSEPDSADFQRFLLTVGQGIDLGSTKTTKHTRADIAKAVVAETMTEGGQFYPLVQELKSWIVKRGPLPASTIELLKGVEEISTHKLHALLDIASYEVARDSGQDLKAFETFATLEADGKTNGPINALMLMATGAITSAWLKNIGKGGVYFGRLGKTLNSHMAIDDKDLYEESSIGTQEGNVEFGKILKAENAGAHDLFLAFNRFLAHLDDANVSLDNDGNIVLKRGITKNPLTITVYASGPKGIAAKITDELVNAVYEKLSEAIETGKPAGDLIYGPGRDEQFMNDFADLMSKRIGVDKETKLHYVSGKQVPIEGTLSDFALTPEQHKKLRENVQLMLVTPMVAAINRNVQSHVVATTSAIQQATQVQSIVLKALSFREHATKLALLKMDPEANDYVPGEGLSEVEQTEIRKNTYQYAPVISTGTQNYDFSGREQADILRQTTVNDEGKEVRVPVKISVNGKETDVSAASSYSRSLSGDMETSAYMYGPDLAGVSAIPTTVVGSGDGQMMLNFLSQASAYVGRVLHVFDGLYMPADAIDGISEKINEAVYKTWTTDQNVVRSMANSFEAFLSTSPLDAVFSETMPAFQKEEALKLITEAAVGHKLKRGDPLISEEGARAFFQEVLQNINDAADETDVRRKLYAEFDLSVDQMASGESPYSHEGVIKLPENIDLDDLADAMEARRLELMAELRKSRQASAAIDKGDDLINVAVAKFGASDESGARVLESREIPALFKALSSMLTPAQKEIARQASRMLEKTEYKIVIGSSSELKAWEQTYNADRYDPDQPSFFGKTDPVSKTILIKNISAETIVHELIHAATIDKVSAFYSDPTLLMKEEREAIERIEGLMSEWMALDTEGYDDASLNARIAAESEIKKRQDKGEDAAALNEFMAWVMSNQHLAARAAKIKVKDPVFRIIGDALRKIKELLWGGPTKGARVGDNILSNLRFNTRVLLATPTRIEILQRNFAKVAVFQTSWFGTNDRLTEIRQRLDRKIISWINEDASDPLTTAIQKQKRQNETNDAALSADSVASVFAYHFSDLGGMQAYSTFEMVQKALMTGVTLDPSALSRIEEIYLDVIGKITPTNLRENNDPNDPNDARLGQDRYDALNGTIIQTTDKHGRSSLMSSFLALAMASEKFRKVLANMEKPKVLKDDSRTLDALLDNVGNSVLNNLSLKLAGEGKSDVNVRDALDSLTTSLLANVSNQQSYIEQRINKIEDYAADTIQDTSEKVIQATRTVMGSNKPKIVKAGAGLVNLVATMINEDAATEASLGLNAVLNKRDGKESLRALLNDLIGRTRNNAPLFSLISKSKSVVSRVRQQFVDELPVKLSKVFKKPPSKAQWTAMFNVLGRTDLALLASRYGNVSEAVNFINNSRRLNSEIQVLENSIQTSEGAARFSTIQVKAKQLANYLNTGDQGEYLLRNAGAIARLLGTTQASNISSPPANQLVEDIDVLVTLYALQGVSQETKDAVSALMQDDRDGVEFVTSYLIGQRVDEMAKVQMTTAATFNYYKGHIPSEAMQGGSLIIASDTEQAKLVMLGYKKLDRYQGSSADRVLGSRSYYFAPVSGQAAFTQGVMQTVHQTASGVDPETGYTIDTVTAGRIENPQIVASIQRQLLSGVTAPTNENLLPVFDNRGRVVAFERAADPAQLTKLNKSTDLAAMIGVWRGRQVEELLAQEVNIELVDALKEIWDKARREGRQREFVNISRLDPDADPILKEAVSLVPFQARGYIRQVFGPDFMVERSMLLDTFGARQASVGDLFTGKTRWNQQGAKNVALFAYGLPFLGKDAYKILVGAEKNLQEVVGNIKTLIVVKSIIVPAANIIANVAQALNRGVPLKDVLKGMASKTAEINSYIKRRNQEINLEADLRAAKGANDLVSVRKLENQIQSLKDGYRRMSIWPLIEAGEFSAISNGRVTEEDLALADGKWTSWVEKKINSLPDGIRTPVRYAMITRDTSLYQGLARAVQYGDFVGKAVVYDHLVNNKRVTSKEAIATVNEVFVNYNRNTGRTRQALENAGLLWFYNFKLRILKESIYMLRHNPLRSLLMIAAPALSVIGEIGSPHLDNVVTIGAEGKLDFSIGWGMGLNSHNLQPWLNAMR